MNCTFSNCCSQAIYGVAQAGTDGQTYWNYAAINPVIKNCDFFNSSNGCVFDILSVGTQGYGWAGSAAPLIIANCIFDSLSGAALLLRQADGYDNLPSPVAFKNNALSNCNTGVNATDPWDAQIQDNIFVGITNAVTVAGSLSRTVSYNNFYANATNFTGYPPTYGEWIIPNRNGTLADLSFNISQDPLFAGTNDFHLQTNSPCIDAGTPDPALAEQCFPPAQGTSLPDLGAYGGLAGCNWLDVVPELPVQLSMSSSNNLVWLNWAGLPRSSYQIEWLPGFPCALPGAKWLTNCAFMDVANPCSVAVSTGPCTNTQGFFRVQSLGRLPGD
jgi:hypothetical protein